MVSLRSLPLLSAMLLLTSTTLLLAREAAADYCHGSPSPTAKQNLNPVYSGAPKLLRTAANGKAYQHGADSDPFWVIHLWGTPYQMGFAQGQMMRAELAQFFNLTWGYFESQVVDAISSLGLPTWLEDAIADFGLGVALDLTWNITSNFSGPYFLQEMQGIADATGESVDRIRRIHMIGELTKGACSMFGAWGQARAAHGGSVLQLRALDWAVDGPFRFFPAVVVYHPASLGHAFANVGFVGWVGSITGMNSKGVAISEIGVAYPDPSFGEESMLGTPFVFLLRDILQFDSSMSQGLARIQGANRTCNLILGVGDGVTDQQFRAVQYSYSVANVQAPDNMMPDNSTWHPRMTDVVYYGMDWLCPGYTLPLHNQISKYYGSITAEDTIRDVVPIVQTGDVHIAIYDLANSAMYVGFARSNDSMPGPLSAYDRTFTRLDMAALFSEQPPAAEELVAAA